MSTCNIQIARKVEKVSYQQKKYRKPESNFDKESERGKRKEKEIEHKVK